MHTHTHTCTQAEQHQPTSKSFYGGKHFARERTRKRKSKEVTRKEIYREEQHTHTHTYETNKRTCVCVQVQGSYTRKGGDERSWGKTRAEDQRNRKTGRKKGPVSDVTGKGRRGGGIQSRRGGREVREGG